MAVKIKTMVFWDVMLSDLVGQTGSKISDKPNAGTLIYDSFILNITGTDGLLQNIVTYLPNRIVSIPGDHNIERHVCIIHCGILF